MQSKIILTLLIYSNLSLKMYCRVCNKMAGRI